MKYCKACKTQLIDEKAKKCPQCDTRIRYALHEKIAIAFIGFVILGFISSTCDETQNAAPQSTASSQSQNKTSAKVASAKSKKTHATVGQVLKTRYFHVKVNKVEIKNQVNVGNTFANLKPQPGTRYLVMNISFANSSNESRMLLDGEVLAIHEGREYKYDNSEIIMQEGWGLLMDQINPMMTLTTNLVYKIPEQLKGPVFYRPGRAGKNDLILLGTL